jgi:N-acetylated-alpha-linked acidic dipeptidase
VLAAALLLPAAHASAAPQDTQNAATLRGYLPSAVSAELDAERTVSTSPNPDDAMRYERGVASVVHRMGQTTNYDIAVYMRDQLAAAGWDAKLVTYVVPIAWPTQQRLEIVAPVTREVDLYEPAVAGDPYSQDHAAIGKPYTGYSPDGEVTGQLIYAGHGTEADLAKLTKMHVDLKGAIILVQQGDGSSATKAKRAAQLGVRAVLNYPEPGYDPYFPQFHSGKTYPDGPARPLGAALRGSLDIEGSVPDPTAIGIPVPGAKHKPMSALKVDSPLPVMTVTALVAQQLSRYLGGPLAPAAWKTKIAPGIHIGGVERVHFVLANRRFFGPIWNVIATMKGAVEPEQTIIVGGHRDAWTYGALDPGSGSVAMLQMAKAFGTLRKSGWQPYRTIVIASWDGEELNEFGSGIWVDQYREQLLHRCWAYVNTDEVATGPTYTPGATDDLVGLLQSVANVAVAPNGSTLAAYWAKQDPKRLVPPNGTGSDHESFEYHLNIPSLGITYAGVFGTWHSAYDDIASLRVFDPGMRFADAAASLYDVLTLRLADAIYPDIRYSADALAMQRRLNAFANGRDHEARRTQVVRTLQPYVAEFSRLARSLDDAVDASSKDGNAAALRNASSLTFAIRMAFYSPQGVPGDPYKRSVLYNSDDVISTLPSLEATLDPKKGKAALDQLVAAFAKLPPILIVSR